MEWIDVEKELPPCDGMYEVTNLPSSPIAEGVLSYDGIGFLLDHAYRPVKFWRNVNRIEKKYGKTKHENDKSFDPSKPCCEGTENLKSDKMHPGAS